MEGKWIGRIICIISTMLVSTYDAKSNPGNLAVNVKVHANGEKVIDASYHSLPKAPTLKSIYSMVIT